MKINRFFYVGMIILSQNLIVSADEIDFNSINTYKGQEITAENILELAPKPPLALENKVQKFLRERPRVAHILSGADYYKTIGSSDKAPYSLDLSQNSPDTPIIAGYFGPIKNALHAAGIHNWRGQNFVIPLDDTIIKASGFSNRRENINAYLRQTDPTQSYGKSITPAQLEKFKNEVGQTTYQTISRIAYWLRIKEIKAALNLDRICVPDKYLIRIPGRPAEVNDTNYVVGEAALRGAKPFDQTDLVEDPEVILQLMQVIGYANLWDINSNNILALNGQACIVDTEQPNVAVPTNFFLKDLKGQKGIGRHGWCELGNNIIQPYGEQHPECDLTQVKTLKKLMEESIQQA
jgi:hypothetical protein